MKNKIGTILFKKIFVWYVVIAIILTLLQIYSEYNEHKKDLNQELNTTQKLYSHMLASAVWNLDKDHIKANIDALVSYDYIYGISIIDPQEYIIGQRGIVSNSEKKYTKYLYEKEKIDYQNNLTQYSFDLVNKKFSSEVLGTVTLYTTHKQILHHMESSIVMIIINSLIKSLVLLFLFLYFSRKIISKPLNELIDSLNKTDLSHNEKISLDSIDISKNNELTVLVSSYNDMQQRIHSEIEENKRKDLLLQQQSKLASMGEMIGNIAHQWRQPLSVISSSASGIKLFKELGQLEPKFVEKSLNRILDNTQYLSKTINDFRDLIHDENPIEKFNLNTIIEKSISIETSVLKENEIKIIKNFDPNINLENYPNALLQVLVNLINNAKDVLIKNHPKSQRYIFINSYIKNNQAVLKIRDNGGGIPEDIIYKVFDAYFTTKHQNQGTGLGLHMSYNLITLHMEGSLDVKNSTYEYDNKKHTGAVFTIRIPL